MGEIHKDTTYHFSPSGVKGCVIMEALVPYYQLPVCTVWFRHVGNATIEILNSYTINPLRRKGYRTYLHKKMIEAYPKNKWIMTHKGQKSSRPWLKKMGFWRDEITKDLMLEVNRKPKKKKANR